MLGERIQIVYFECEMRDVVSDADRTAAVKFANLDLFFAPWRLEKDELRASWRFRPVNLFQSKHVLIERDCLFQVRYPVAGVQEFLNHRPPNCHIQRLWAMDSGGPSPKSLWFRLGRRRVSWLLFKVR